MKYHPRLKPVRILFVLILALLGVLPCFPDGHVPEILIIHSYHPSFAWTWDLHRGMVDTWEAEGSGTSFTVEYMDTKRIVDERHIEALVTLYEAKYRESPPDVVVCSDNNAFAMLMEYRHRIFGFDIPVVFCGVNFFNRDEWPGRVNILGVDERPDYGVAINLIDSLFSSPPHVVFLSADSVSGKLFQNEFRKWIPGWEDPERFSVVVPDSPEDILEIQKTLPEDTVFLMGTYSRDKAGNFYQASYLPNIIAESGQFPVFGTHEAHLGEGLVGGPIISGYDQGGRAMEMALEILNGTRDPSVFYLEDSPYQFIFDYPMVRQTGIPLSRLPAGSTIINTPTPFYQRYPVETILALTLLIVLILAIIILSSLFRSRNRLLARIGRMNEELELRVEERTEELGKVQADLLHSEKMADLGSLVGVVTHEVATPLGLGLVGAGYLQERFRDIRKAFDNDNLQKDDFVDFLDTGLSLSKTMEDNLKRASGQIGSFKRVAVDQLNDMPREFNLAGSIEDFLLSMEGEMKRTHLEVKVDCPADIVLYHYPGDLWRVLANLLMNSKKHGFEEGESGLISISASVEGDSLKLIFADNGCGIPESDLERIFEPYFTTAREKGGSGLGTYLVRSIVEERHGGRISVRNLQPTGVEFTITMPLQKRTTDES